MMANIISTSFQNWEAVCLSDNNISAANKKCKRNFKTAVFEGKTCTKCKKNVHKMQGYLAKIRICRIACVKAAFRPAERQNLVHILQFCGGGHENGERMTS